MCAVFALCLSASGALDAGCAGDLKDPERFDEIVQRAASAGTSGRSSSYGAGAGGGAAGKAGSAGTGNTAVPPAPACVTALFAKSCATSVACHAANGTQVDLASSNVEKRLVGIDAPSTSIWCQGRKLIATDGSSSLLLDKLQDDTPPCGSKMPLTGTISADELKCVSDWVDTVSMSAVGGP